MRYYAFCIFYELILSSLVVNNQGVQQVSPTLMGRLLLTE